MRIPTKHLIAATVLATGAMTVSAQGSPAAPAKFEGAVVLVSGSAEIEVDNDEAFASFYLEIQDADLTKAQSLVNQRVADGTAALKRADPKASIETAGYSSYPIYSTKTNVRTITGWRIRQDVMLRTTDLAALPKAVSAGQQQLALGGISFRLSRATREKHEAELIRQAVANFNAKVAAAAQALNVPPARVRVEELNFGVRPLGGPPIVAYAQTRAPVAMQAVPEPELSAGRSTLQQTVEGKVRLLLP
jgi:predicted secreted protein